MAFVVVRERWFTVQCVVTVQPNTVNRQMVKYVARLSRESVIDVEGLVSVPSVEIKGTTQQGFEPKFLNEKYLRNADPFEGGGGSSEEIASRAPVLSFNIEDAARRDAEIEKALQAGEKLVLVNQDTCLNNRVLDLRTQAKQGIFSIQSEVGNIFRGFLLFEGFSEIHTPKLIAGSSEGDAVDTLDYKGQPACLTQSPQLHKQMAICAEFSVVFEMGPVYRGEDSNTHRHLCEFTGLDVEMEIDLHYSEVMDVVARLFVTIFGTLNKTCQKELEAVGRQYPFEPLKDAGVEVDPMGDLNTEAKRKLGKTGTTLSSTYCTGILWLLGRSIRCLATIILPTVIHLMFLFEREHRPELLEKRAQACGIELKTISTYIDAIRNGGNSARWVRGKAGACCHAFPNGAGWGACCHAFPNGAGWGTHSPTMVGMGMEMAYPPPI
ncbi:PREDICTED: aspartate--tRNA ligase [Prunus dulcis]|uniref:PREDICTED: aspartate--tRNA ligase n=1 Tax=Prunus dulcis TaxID=3755 RepID=A0A5E4G6P1_PRUDU|nr:PREDICTED: aspartate--tRNA ligase [Prunus dulcis]